VSRDSYRAFLTEAYHHVKHTVPLLMACGARLPERLEWLRRGVAEYIDEEYGHEHWILADLAAAGFDAAAARERGPSPETELMVAYAYDTVQRGNPVGFFGMVLVLEGTSAAIATHAAVIIAERLALPRQAFTYLVSHGSLDQQHVGQFDALVDKLGDAGDRAAVLHAARMFYKLYGDVFRALPRADVAPTAGRVAA
jgi:pyrroloquinoline quinone (PQQ) biosynthesis protein C